MSLSDIIMYDDDNHGFLWAEQIKAAIKELKERLKEANWNIEDIWDMNLPPADKMVDDLIGEVFGEELL